MHLSHAVQHESSKDHILRYRKLIEPPSHANKPLDSCPTAGPESCEPAFDKLGACASQHTQVGDYSDASHSLDPTFSSTCTIAGPALDCDDPSQLYDDFSGVWGEQEMEQAGGSRDGVNPDEGTSPSDMAATGD